MRSGKYLQETLKALDKMEKQTEDHSPGCSCHTCIYKRDIQSRPEIQAIRNKQ